MNLSDEQIKQATGLTQAQLDEEKIRQAAVKQANATPLPGASAAAYDISPEIVVGKYKVRPWLDGDFKRLEKIAHPFYKMIIGEQKDFIPRGQDAWEICWFFTHDVDEVWNKIKIDGIEKFKETAAEEFEKQQLGLMVAIIGAIIKQHAAYWGPVLAYESDSEDGTKKNLSLDQPAKSPTVSDG